MIYKEKFIPSQPYSLQAKKRLEDLVLNRVVEIKSYGLDCYNRVLGVVYLDKININLEMVKQGLAEVYYGETPKDLDLKPYREAESKARNAKIEMWSLYSQG